MDFVYPKDNIEGYYEGYIAHFNFETKFGFVEVPGFVDDVFFHWNDMK